MEEQQSTWKNSQHGNSASSIKPGKIQQIIVKKIHEMALQSNIKIKGTETL